jgi:NAD(P)-dependent dehydrogenase (short-subunit alcohol dehydrogenase family)
MNLGIKDRVAIVTGSNKGLGRAEAEALAAEGATVVIATFRSMDQAKEVVDDLVKKGHRAISVQADVTKAEEVERLMATTINQFGRLDILVNNAGTTGPQYNKPLTELPGETWDFLMTSHLKSAFLCIKYAAPHMIKQGWGRIINTSSIHARTGGRIGMGAYAAAKAGVISLTLTASKELGPKGITVNAIAPGFFVTETLRNHFPPERLEKLAQQNPLGRLGTPKEIAGAVTFLASESASYINGTVLDVNGGRFEYFI